MNCRTCQEYIFSTRKHKCLPAWDVTEPEQMGDGEWRKFHATDDEAAAEKAAEFWDRDDGPSTHELILVKPHGKSGPIEAFRVTHEMTVVYTAREKK